MSTVSLDLQRRCEQRWAARFEQPEEPVADREHRLETRDQQLAKPIESKRKTSQLDQSD
jgi:hypothetical protein